MAHDRPGPGEELHDGPAVQPRPAASVILVRGGAEALEVLLVKRNPAVRFMGGAWVFPGGSVDPAEGEGDVALRAAALRELEEEAGVTLDGVDRLQPFSRWITPPEASKRFDTHFFVAELPAGAEVVPDGHECVDAGWFSPTGALAARDREEIDLVFPTIKHLEQLEAFPTVQALMDAARGREVVPVQPRIVGDGEQARVLLPGEPGFDAL